jgi:hypothetical protein
MNNSTSILSKLSTGEGLNFVNIGLMLISLIAAYILPFELFLFSYGVLGPLHYLTEISWLEKKNYFLKSKNDIWLLVLIVIFMTYGLFDAKSKTNLLIGSFLFSGFIYALIILFVEKQGVKLILLFLTFILSLAFNVNKYPELPFLLFAVLLPTVIHVFIFTGSFILFGALKSRSKSGIISLVVFIACGLTFFIYVPQNIGLPVTDYGKESYSLFRVLNITLYKLVGFGDLQIDDSALYFGPQAIAVMRFIAFAYTYHYLNWFSKTTVIKWNDVSKKRMAIIITLWVLSVALYVFSYRIGFYALFLLSMLHVFLEFPLNHHTFIGIGKEVKTLFKK